MDWRWNGGLGGELAVIGDLRSIASLGVFGSGVGSISALCFEVSSWFHFSISSASPHLTVFSGSFLPSHLSCSIPCVFPPQQVVSSLALLNILLASWIFFLRILWISEFLSMGLVYFFSFLISCPSIKLVSVVPVLGRCLLPRLRGQCLLCRDEVDACCPKCEVSACCPGMRSVPFVPVLDQCQLFPLRGLHRLSRYEVSSCCPICVVGAFCPGMRLVPVFPVLGRCLLAR